VTPLMGASSNWDIVVYPLGMIMPWVGLACAIAASRASLPRYRRALLGVLGGYLLLLALFAALVGLW
jgi:hypothetical protein